MKELSIEEKAKRYDEALDKAKQFSEKPYLEDSKSIVEYLFPELKESEDEKMRKKCIELIKELETFCMRDGQKECIAWLEKKGEQKVQGKSAQEAAKEEKIDNQNCVKPVDEVEAKFKVGDWIVGNINKVTFLISSVNNGYCTLKDIEGRTYSPCLPPIEDDYHLWTIQDAKDGDVLYMDNGLSTCTFIYKSIDNVIIQKYASYNKFGFEGTTYLVLNDGYVNPATKEQRDTLMKAMADAGYTFDFEKKELKKFEQKPNMLKSCEIEHIEHGKFYYCIKDYYDAGNKIASKGDVIQALKGTSIMGLGVRANEYFIPVYRIIQKHAEWSEEDEKMLDSAISYINYSPISRAGLGQGKTIKWLKRLKDRVKLQPKQGWTEKDIAMVNFIALILRKYQSDENFITFETAFEDCIDWFKSLKDKYAWKPSKEQLEALRRAHLRCPDVEDGLLLREIIEQLKKLKG